MDSSLLVAWVMIAVFGISLLYPWHPGWPGAKWLVHLPLLLLPLGLLYEKVLPRHMNIRFDLLLYIYALEIIGVIYAVRLILFFFLRRRSRRKAVHDSSA